MFYFDENTDIMYYITRESAKRGISNILTSRVNKRFDSGFSRNIISDIMSNISIPNEYRNDKCIYMSVDDECCNNTYSAYNLDKSKRFSITASEVIRCLNKKNGSEIVPYPIPKCSLKDFNTSYYLPLDSTVLFKELSEKSVNNGVIKQSGNLNDMTFSISESYETLICKILREVFSTEYSSHLAKRIVNSMSNDLHKFFVYRIVNQKPVIYAISHNGVQLVDTEAKLSAANIVEIINPFVTGIPGVDNAITKLANKIHNMVLYDIDYDKEELNNPYEYDGKKFNFKMTKNGIDFIFRHESDCWPVRFTSWISDLICVPFKDITWGRTTEEAGKYIVSDTDYVEPSYNGFRLAYLGNDVDFIEPWKRSSKEDYSDLPKIDEDKNIYVFASTVNLKNKCIELNGKWNNVKDDTPVYIMVAMDTYKNE